MVKNKNKKIKEQMVEKQIESTTVGQTQPQEEPIVEVSETEILTTKVAELEARVAELEDLKLRQMAEFDNFRRRTNKEKLELMTTAGERIFKDMLPLVDDFERS